MASRSDPPKARGAAAAAVWAALTPEERSARGRALRGARSGATPGSFKAGDPKTIEAGRKGGKATGPSKARNMKGVKRTKPLDPKQNRDLQTTRGMD